MIAGSNFWNYRTDFQSNGGKIMLIVSALRWVVIYAFATTAKRVHGAKKVIFVIMKGL